MSPSRLGRVDLRTASLPVPRELVEVAAALEADAVRWVLTGGEDHALAATFPPNAELPPGWTPVGLVGEGAGVFVDGEPYAGTQGWDHFNP